MVLIAFPDEPLHKHLEDVTDEISRRFLFKRSKLLTKLLKSYIDIDLDNIKHAIIYTGIFHDVGKAYEPFQETLRQKGTAPHHEVFSVFFLDKVLVKMNTCLKKIILLTIAWHHLSTRGAVLERIGGTIDKFLPIDSVKLNEYSRKVLSEILQNILLKFECGEEIDLSNIPKVISVNDVKNLLDELGRSVRREKNNSYRIYLATIPLLTALQVADAKVSFKNRKTGTTLPLYIKDITDLDIQKKIVQTLMKL